MKAVFDTKANSAYDDRAGRVYHFPSNYLSLVEASVGDWVVFREPRADGGSMSYFGVGQVRSVRPDPTRRGLYYADIDNFLPFDQPVPWRPNGRYWEGALRDLQVVGNAGASIRGRSVRRLEDGDFAALVGAGLRETLNPDNSRALDLGLSDIEQAAYVISEAQQGVQERRIAEVLLNRKIRDANFRRHVCRAYDNRCAITGLRIVNGGGRAEVQAAHIWPVSDGGPDTIQNGIALSATAHWLFDRHLVSITDDYGLLVSHNKVPAELRTLFQKHMIRIHLPDDRRLWPHPDYLERHREAFASAEPGALFS